jgi:hypothetical protein
MREWLPEDDLAFVVLVAVDPLGTVVLSDPDRD